LTGCEKTKIIDIIIKKANLLKEMGRPHIAIKFLISQSEKYNEITELLEKYKNEYKNESGLEFGDPKMEKIEIFLDWLRENGAKFSKIRMKYYGLDYRGVHAVKMIPGEEVFLWVPKKLIITPQMGKDTEIGQKLIKSGVTVGWDYLTYITLFLLIQQHDEKSFWKPYMDVYPKTVDSFPLFFSDPEKSLLKGSPMYDQISSDTKDAQIEYNKLCELVPEFKQFSFEDYLKNKTLVTSRIFYVSINNSTDRIMVPLAGIFSTVLI